MSPAKPKGKTSQHLRSAMPLIKELVRPRRKLLGLGFFLMLINRGAGLVLPGSTKYLVDNVIVKQQVWLLKPLVLAVFVATLVQGATSFTLTQLLSKEAQRLIAQLRRKVQEHVGRLPVAYYDANKIGRAGLAHHERRGRRPQPGRHGPGGFRGRDPDGGFLA